MTASLLVLLIAVLLGYILDSKEVRKIPPWILAFLTAVLLGALISWVGVIFEAFEVYEVYLITIEAMLTVEQLIEAAVIAVVGLVAGLLTNRIAERLIGMA